MSSTSQIHGKPETLSFLPLLPPFPANPQPVPDCGPGATRCAPRACSLGHPVTLPFAAITGGSSTPAAAAPRLVPERGERRRDWLRASPSARAENRLRASPAAQGKRQASPVGGVSPSFCCHSFHLIHLFSSPRRRSAWSSWPGAAMACSVASFPGREDSPTGFRRPKPPGCADQA